MRVFVKTWTYAAIWMQIMFFAHLDGRAMALTDSERMVEVSGMALVADSSGRMDFRSVQEDPTLPWRPLRERTVPDDAVKAYWLRFELENPFAKPQEIVLAFDRWGLVEVYVEGNAEPLKTGQSLPHNRRNYPFNSALLVKLELDAGEARRLWIRLDQSYNPGLPPYSLKVHCGSRQASDKEQVLLVNINIIVLAILAFILIYNLFFFFSTREIRYRFYLLNVLLVTLESFRAAGFYGYFLTDWAHLPEFEFHLLLFQNYLAALVLPLLFRDYMETKIHLKSWDRILLWIAAPTTGVYLISLVDLYLALFLVALLISVGTLFFIYWTWLLARKKHPMAPFFFFALLFFSTGNILHALSHIGWLELGVMGETLARAFGVVISDVILSFGLGRQVASLKLENERKGKKIIEALQEREQFQIEMGRGILSSQEKVRETVAVKLHDDIQNLLVTIRFNLLALRTVRSETRGGVDEVIGLLKSSIKKVRRISHDLMPAALADADGLGVSIENYIHRVPSPKEIGFHYPSPASLPASLRTLVYRIVQESVSHSLKDHPRDDLKISIDHPGPSVEILVEASGESGGRPSQEKWHTLGYNIALFGGREEMEVLKNGSRRMKITLPVLAREKEADQ